MRLILHNADGLTMDYLRPFAGALAIEAGRILAMGSAEEISEYRTPDARLIDCRGGTLFPGFVDAHCHLLAFAASLLSENCSPDAASSIADIQEALRLRAARTPPGQWLRATGYDETALKERRHPTRWDLDAAASGHPVRLVHRTGHACVLNSIALERAGIGGETPELPGGYMERDLETGEPTGLLIEMNELVDAALPPLSEDDMAEGVRQAAAVFLSQGVTSIQDATSTNGPVEWDTFVRLIDEGTLPLSVTLMEGLDSPGALPETAAGDRLRRGPVKIAIKELGDEINPDEEELAQMVRRVHAARRQVAVHAVGRRAVAGAVAAIERAVNDDPCPDHRHRIEHCGICPPDLARRISRSGIVVVTQPGFLYHSGDRYLAQVDAADLPYLYPLRRLLAAGVSLAAASDAPVAPPSPLRSIQAAVLRQSRAGASVGPEQTLGTKEALRMHLLNASWAAFDEERRGSIAPGKIADLVLLSGNPLATAAGEISDLEVLMTVVGGEVAYQSGP